MAKREWHGMLDEDIDLQLRSIQLEINRKLLKKRTHISRANLVNLCMKRCFKTYSLEEIVTSILKELNGEK
jgi:hypothetical protein